MALLFYASVLLLATQLAFTTAGYGNGYGQSYGHGNDYGHGGHDGYMDGYKPAGYAEGAAHVQPHYGYGHHHYVKGSCADHYKPGAKNGFYKIYSASVAGPMKVYCDFNSEPGYAYTMVMFSGSDGRLGLDSAKFTTVGLTENTPVNPYTPNKFAYRQTLADMSRIKGASKIWRITCDENDDPESKDNVLWKDYLRVKIADADPLAALPRATATNGCHNVEYVQTSEDSTKSCALCTVGLLQTSSSMLQVVNGDGGACGLGITAPIAPDKYFLPDEEEDFCDKGVGLWFGKRVV